MADRTDTERLDWLERKHASIGFDDILLNRLAEWVVENHDCSADLGRGPTLRDAINAAIDAAMEADDAG